MCQVKDIRSAAMEYLNDCFSNSEICRDLDILDFDNSSDLLNGIEESLDFKSGIFLEPCTKIGPPAKGDFEGNYKFEVLLSGETSSKKKYLYSNNLNRVYLGMMSELPIQFQWDWNGLKERKLFIRATLVLARNEHQEKRVLRCSIHKELCDGSNKDIPESAIPHVLRSARKGGGVFYCGDEQEPLSWLSVAFEPPTHPPDGASAIQHVYMFCCKHSCIAGINRRPIEVLFTLEDLNGEILGRRSLGVRVCSCPRRDLGKDEEEYVAKNGTNGPPTKKKKTTHSGSQHFGTVNSSSQAIHGLYNFGLISMKLIPSDNPAMPHLENLVAELQKQIEMSKK